MLKYCIHTKLSVEIFDVTYHCFQLKLPLFDHSLCPMSPFQSVIVLPLCLSVRLQITDFVHHELLLVIGTHVDHIFLVRGILVLRLLHSIVVPADNRRLMLLLIPMEFCHLIILYRSTRDIYLFSDTCVLASIENSSRFLP